MGRPRAVAVDNAGTQLVQGTSRIVTHCAKAVMTQCGRNETEVPLRSNYFLLFFVLGEHNHFRISSLEIPYRRQVSSASPGCSYILIHASFCFTSQFMAHLHHVHTIIRVKRCRQRAQAIKSLGFGLWALMKILSQKAYSEPIVAIGRRCGKSMPGVPHLPSEFNSRELTAPYWPA